MRILIAGDWHSNIHEDACYKALKNLGHDVYGFSWCDYFRGPVHNDLSNTKKFIRKLQNKFLFGPLLQKINEDLVEKTRSISPEAVLIYRGSHITKSTLELIKQNNNRPLLISYNNDDPFSPKALSFLWRHFKKSISCYDINFVYRGHNIHDFKKAGAKNVHLLRSYYIPERNFPISLTEEDKDKYQCDVVFAGHYEPDGRETYLEKIVEEGISFRLFGPEWNHVIKKSENLSKYYPVEIAWDDEYNKALCGAKIALAFFSKLNRDTYTRRCFEIPATKTFMLSEYSDDMASIFQEGLEAEYFRNINELIEKIRYYLDCPDKIKQIAENGYNKVVSDGHDVTSRMRYAIDVIQDHMVKSS